MAQITGSTIFRLCMLFEAILVIAIITTGFIAGLDYVMSMRHRWLFRTKPKLVVISQTLFPVMLVVLAIRSFSFETFRIPTGSMKPTLVEGDLVVVDKYSHGLRVPLLGYRLTNSTPKRGDIAVFRGEVEGAKAGVIKRIVGLPGDHIKYHNRTLYVNGKPATQLNINTDFDNDKKVIRATEDLGNVQHDIFMALKNDHTNYPFQELTVPENAYFVLGDHRSNSQDSRYWGVVADQRIIGKARLIAFSLDWPKKKIRWQRIGVVK